MTHNTDVSCQLIYVAALCLSQLVVEGASRLDKAQSVEAAECQVKMIENRANSVSSSIAAVSSGPRAGGRESCRAFSNSCTFCSKLNHFAKARRSHQVSHRPPSLLLVPVFGIPPDSCWHSTFWYSTRKCVRHSDHLPYSRVISLSH